MLLKLLIPTNGKDKMKIKDKLKIANNLKSFEPKYGKGINEDNFIKENRPQRFNRNHGVELTSEGMSISYLHLVCGSGEWESYY